MHLHVLKGADEKEVCWSYTTLRIMPGGHPIVGIGVLDAETTSEAETKIRTNLRAIGEEGYTIINLTCIP